MFREHKNEEKKMLWGKQWENAEGRKECLSAGRREDVVEEEEESTKPIK